MPLKESKFGLGFEMAKKPGSEVHDEIAWNEEHGYYRKSNRLGGLGRRNDNGYADCRQGRYETDSDIIQTA